MPITHDGANAKRFERLRAHRAVRAAWLALPLVALVSIFTVSDLRGVDFGDHWDELPWQVRPVRDMVASGLLLPRATIYPSLVRWMILVPALPGAIRDLLKPGKDPREVQKALAAKIDTPAYLLTLRRIFIAVCALTIVWVYGASGPIRRLLRHRRGTRVLVLPDQRSVADHGGLRAPGGQLRLVLRLGRPRPGGRHADRRSEGHQRSPRQVSADRSCGPTGAPRAGPGDADSVAAVGFAATWVYKPLSASFATP